MKTLTKVACGMGLLSLLAMSSTGIANTQPVGGNSPLAHQNQLAYYYYHNGYYHNNWRYRHWGYGRRCWRVCDYSGCYRRCRGPVYY